MIKIEIDLNAHEFKGLENPDNFARFSEEEVIKAVTGYMAWGSQIALRTLLKSRIDGISVKASGMASENLYVADINRGHVVYEGAMTKANKFMREGTRKAAGKKAVPVQRILDWMLTKGIGNFNLQDTTLTAGGQDPLERTAWAIARTIAKKGTSTAHKPLYPSNARRFDYVGYAVIRLRMIDRLFEQLTSMHFPLLNRVVVGYLKSGRFGQSTAFKRIRPKIKL